MHLLANGGVAPKRLSVIGLGEWHPIETNDTVDGRNANRRVLLVILSGADADRHRRQRASRCPTSTADAPAAGARDSR